MPGTPLSGTCLHKEWRAKDGQHKIGRIRLRSDRENNR